MGRLCSQHYSTTKGENTASSSREEHISQGSSFAVKAYLKDKTV